MNVEVVCLITDEWTSSNNTHFIVVMAYYVDENFMMKSNLLGCINFQGKQNSQNIPNLSLNEANECITDVQNKVTAIISNNTPNILAEIQLCEWQHICFAYGINLVVQSTIHKIQYIVSEMQRISEHFKRSSHTLVQLHSYSSE
jgi:hypothetical protein